MWERACSRRGRCSRWISCVRNTAFANKADRHPGRSYRSTRYLVGASLLAKSPVQSMDFLRQEYSLREQGGSPPRSLLQEHAVSCGSELAREESGAVDGFPASGIPPSRTSSYGSTRCPVGADLSAKRAVHSMHWLRLEYSLREQVRSYGSTRYLVGASLLAKSPVQSMDFLRQEYRLREQVRSYRSTRCPVGADLSAKRAVHSMHWLRLEYSLREQVRSYGSTRYLVGASLLAKRPVQSMDFLRQSDFYFSGEP